MQPLHFPTILRATGPSVLRRPPHTEARGHFVVSLQERGSGRVQQDGREARLEGGDLALCDGTHAHVIALDAGAQALLLHLPHEQLTPLVRRIGELTATRMCGDSAAARLLASAMRALAAQDEGLPAAASVSIAAGIAHLAAAALLALDARRQRALSTLAAYHLDRLKRLIDARLRERRVRMADIAREAGLSERQVQRLFEAEGAPPARYLWNRRLEGCARELADPERAAQPVGQIALRWGFGNSAHFSRAFRHRFGCSPRAWRRHAHGEEA